MQSPLRNNLRFPSGLSVSTVHKHARRQHTTSKIPLNRCLDLQALENGLNLPWSKALEFMLANALQVTSEAPLLMSDEDLKNITSRHPTLNQNGFGVVHMPWNEGTYEDSLARQRELNPYLLPQCNLALAFLSLFMPNKEINRDQNMASIELKHHAENALKLVRPQRNNYIPQGALIIAALHRGFLIANGPGGFYRGAFFNIKPAPQLLDRTETAQNELTTRFKQRLIEIGIEYF